MGTLVVGLVGARWGSQGPSWYRIKASRLIYSYKGPHTAWRAVELNLQSNLVLSALKTAPFSLRNWKQSSELEKPNSLWTKDTPTIGRNLHLLIGMISRLMKRSTNEKENRSFMLTTNNSQVKEQQNLLKEIKYLSKIHIK